MHQKKCNTLIQSNWCTPIALDVDRIVFVLNMRGDFILDFTEQLEVDIAYFILTKSGEPIYFKDLILDIIDKKHKPVQSLSKAISEVYTLLNMDSRFHHMGKGVWGLTEWVPQEVKRTHATTTATKAAKKPTSKRREKLLEEIQEHDTIVKPSDNE